MESIFDILLIPMGYILRFAYSLTDNYLFSIFVFTLVMEILLTPFAIKQQKNSIKQANLAPKTMAIRKKYAGRNDQVTQRKMQEEITEMYQRENFNPASGCGTLLIQLPIIICLYNVVTQPLRYICNIPSSAINALQEFISTSEGVTFSGYNVQIQLINHIKDNISDYFEVCPQLEGAVIPNFTVGPFDLSQTPNISFAPFNWLMLIPVVTFFVMILSQNIMKKFTYQPPESAEAQNSLSMKIMTWTMPLISVYIEFQMAAAIGVYWIFRSIIQTIQKIVVSKIYPVPKFTEEDYKKAEQEIGMSNRQRKKQSKQSGEKKYVRSLHHIDDEEWLAAHPAPTDDDDGDDAPAESEKTESSSAPAPIKNDERTSYKNKNN